MTLNHTNKKHLSWSPQLYFLNLNSIISFLKTVKIWTVIIVVMESNSEYHKTAIIAQLYSEKYDKLQEENIFPIITII